MIDDLENARHAYPRVSEIISRQNQTELRSVPLDALANAALRGTQIHAYCTAWMRNLFLPEIEAEYVPYFNAFIEWAEFHVEAILHTDVTLYDDDLKFRGTFDAIVKLKGEPDPMLIDIKTSSAVSKTWPVQLAAYMHLCHKNNYKVNQMMNVHLKKLKPAKFEEKQGEKVLVSPPVIKSVPIRYEDLILPWEIFSSALKCYDYFERKEVW